MNIRTVLFICAALWIVCGTDFAAADTYRLEISYREVNVTGKTLRKIAVNGAIPGPTLRFVEGEDVVIEVTNNLDEDSSIHWHGLLLPGEMDGVPGTNGFPGIKPGTTFTYRFKIRQSGTYWYHAHSLAQEQEGHYGSIVITPRNADSLPADSDYVVLLSDFAEEKGLTVLDNLKIDSGYYNFHKRTISDFFHDIEEKGFFAAWRNALDWGEMRMSQTDLADVSGYTFLMNGKTPDQNWTGIFEPGKRVRLRFINASAMTFFDVRIPGLKMTVVQADGQNIEPVEVDEFRFGIAETYDVIVQPNERRAYTVAAESIDRTGFALGTLSPEMGMRGEVPASRPRALLTMADMGSGHMDHSAHEGMGHGGEEMTSGWADAGTPPGHKALDYDDLRFFGVQPKTGAPEREISVRLGGSMERFIWTMNGEKFEHSSPIRLRYGERVRLTFINDTMMAHPMHLHGMFMQLENGQPENKLPNKHTIIIPPGSSRSALLTADEPGEWAFHCHLLYHMLSGMMMSAVVAEPSASGEHASHGGHPTIFRAFQFESDIGEGEKTVASWDFDGWIGSDFDRLWLKSEGETEDGDRSQAEFWAMYSRNIAEFWDAQIGVRYDDVPQSLFHLVAGVDGLAPYFFETEAHFFVSEDGDLSARLRQEFDLLITQRLILQPYFELNVFAQDVPELDTGAGFSSGELGLQARYEVTRKFAPFIELRYERAIGETSRIARQEGEGAEDFIASVGLRLRF